MEQLALPWLWCVISSAVSPLEVDSSLYSCFNVISPPVGTLNKRSHQQAILHPAFARLAYPLGVCPEV